MVGGRYGLAALMCVRRAVYGRSSIGVPGYRRDDDGQVLL